MDHTDYLIFSYEIAKSIETQDYVLLECKTDHYAQQIYWKMSHNAYDILVRSLHENCDTQKAAVLKNDILRLDNSSK